MLSDVPSTLNDLQIAIGKDIHVRRIQTDPRQIDASSSDILHSLRYIPTATLISYSHIWKVNLAPEIAALDAHIVMWLRHVDNAAIMLMAYTQGRPGDKVSLFVSAPNSYLADILARAPQLPSTDLMSLLQLVHQFCGPVDRE